MPSNDGRFVVQSKGRWAVCNGLFITMQDPSCVCGPPYFLEYCPCEQRGCHPTHSLLFIASDHPAAQCGTLLHDGWCYQQQTRHYSRTEVQILFYNFPYMFIEGDASFLYRCLDDRGLSCQDPLCIPSHDTCQCGTDPCSRVCYEILLRDNDPQGLDPVFCCRGAFRPDGRPSHNWVVTQFYRSTISWGRGCYNCPAYPLDWPTTCINAESHVELTGNEERNVGLCSIRKETRTIVDHDRTPPGPGTIGCGPDRGPYVSGGEGAVLWRDEPSLPGIFNRTSFQTLYSSTECGCTGFATRRVTEVGTCTYFEQIIEQHTYSCSYSSIGQPAMCCVDCTLDQVEIFYYRVDKISGPDTENCCTHCQCYLRGDPNCEQSGGFCPHPGNATGDYIP